MKFFYDERMNKEEQRALRKAAYQKAKAARDNDPAYQALKQKMKDEQKARYQAFKKKCNDEKKAARQERQKARDEVLMEVFGLKDQLRLLSFE